MAQYLLSVWHDDEYEIDFSSEDAQRQIAQVGSFNADLEAHGVLRFACGLQPASSATVVHGGGADVSVREGPYSDSKARMGGFWIIEAASHEEALEWATQAAQACEGPVELRPLQG